MERIDVNGHRSTSLPFFLAGLGAGIAVTLLLAPLSGAATRRLIGRRVKDGEEWMRSKAGAAKDFVRSYGAGSEDTKEAEAVARTEPPSGSRIPRL